MNKQDAINYINEKCYDTNGIIVFDLETLMSEANAQEMGYFENDEMKQILKETAEVLMKNALLQSDLDDALSGVIHQHLANK